MRIAYEIIPPLSLDERLLVMKAEQEDEKKGYSASAIGLIYSKDDIKTGRHGYPINYAFTKMYYKILKYIELSIVGIYKKKQWRRNYRYIWRIIEYVIISVCKE